MLCIQTSPGAVWCGPGSVGRSAPRFGLRQNSPLEPASPGGFFSRIRISGAVLSATIPPANRTPQNNALKEAQLESDMWLAWEGALSLSEWWLFGKKGRVPATVATPSRVRSKQQQGKRFSRSPHSNVTLRSYFLSPRAARESPQPPHSNTMAFHHCPRPDSNPNFRTSLRAAPVSCLFGWGLGAACV